MSEAETTLWESLHGTLTDLRELVIPPAPTEPGREALAVILGRLAEELAEASAMSRALPGRPAPMPGHEHMLLAALRTAQAAGEDVPEFISRGLARLADDRRQR